MSENQIGMPESSSESSSGPYSLHGNALTLTVLGIVLFILVLLTFHYKHRIQRGPRARLQFAVAQNLGGPRLGSPCKGLDDTVLQTLPVFSFASVQAQREGGLGGGGGSGVEWQCAVCLSPFEGGDEVRLLPRCVHSFHATCIDLWFRSHSNCPLCRQCIGRDDDDNNNNNNTMKNATVAEVVISISESGNSTNATTTTTANDDASTATASSPQPGLKVATLEVEHGGRGQ